MNSTKASSWGKWARASSASWHCSSSSPSQPDSTSGGPRREKCVVPCRFKEVAAPSDDSTTSTSSAALALPSCSACLAATGFYLEFPDAVISVGALGVSRARHFAPGTTNRNRTYETGLQQAILPDQAVAIARTLPDAKRVMWLGLPQHDARDSYSQSDCGNRERSDRREGKAKCGSINTAARSCECRTGDSSPVEKPFVAWLFPASQRRSIRPDRTLDRVRHRFHAVDAVRDGRCGCGG
jgi:hypothetical protein